MDFLKEKIDLYFNELVLAALFIATLIITVHLMHKSDAGGQDAAFIVWAENAAFLILTNLINLMMKPKNDDTKTPQDPSKP